MRKKKPKKKLPNPSEMKSMVAALQKSRYYKTLFDTQGKKEFMEPFFGFVVPLLLTVVGDLGPEDGFEFLFSSHFKAMCIATLVQIKAKVTAVEEVDRLAKDLNLKLPKTTDE